MADKSASPEAKQPPPSSSPLPPSTSSPLAKFPEPAIPFQTAEHWLTREHIEFNDDDDSAIGDDNASSTASLTSSILAYRTINGRTYHADRGTAKYWAANDERQNKTLDMQHHLFLIANNGKLQFAPIKKDIKKALDIGTGTGIWAVDFADEHPDTQVWGTDISPIQTSYVPPNLKFEIEDCGGDWTFGENSMDYIHMRALYGSISSWEHLFRQAYKTLAPGGWLESFEASARFESDGGLIVPGTALFEWGNFFYEGGKRVGRTFDIIEPRTQEKLMKEMDMEDIGVHELKIPVGAWPEDPKQKEIGRFCHATIGNDLEGYVSYFAKLLNGWEMKEVMAYCAHCRSEMRSGKLRPYFKLRGVWGRKPMA